MLAQLDLPLKIDQEPSPGIDTELFHALKERGFAEVAAEQGIARNRLREEVIQAAPWATEGRTLQVKWMAADGTEEPCAALGQRLSEMIEFLLIEIAWMAEDTQNHPEWGIAEIGRLFEEYLSRGHQLMAEYLLGQSGNRHVLCALQTVAVTYFTTLTELQSAICDYESKPDYETRPECVEFECAGALGGLHVMRYPFREDRRQSMAKAPEKEAFSEARDGVTTTEIANIYRCSRVTISNVLRAVAKKVAESFERKGFGDDVIASSWAEKERWRPEGELYTRAEAVQYLGSEAVLWEAREGGLTAVEWEGRYYYQEQDLEEWAD